MVAFALLAALLLQDDPHALVQQLGSDDLELRDTAQAKLVQLGAAALPALEKGAKSDIEEIRSRSNHILSGFNYKNRAFVLSFASMGEVGVTRLLKELGTRTDQDERRLLIEALGLSKSEKALDAIKAETRAKEGETRRVALAALGNFATKEAVDTLMASVNDPDPRYRSTVLLALGRTKTPTAIGKLIGGLRDADPRIRTACTEGLLAAACDTTADEIAKGLSLEEPFTIQYCITLLGRVKAKKHRDAIAKHVAGADKVACAAVWALGQMGECRETVKAALERAPSVACMAAEALWRMGDKGGLALLYRTLEGEHAALAEDRLRAMTGKELGKDVAKWKALLEK